MQYTQVPFEIICIAYMYNIPYYSLMSNDTNSHMCPHFQCISGNTSSFLDSRGFGWVFETSFDDSDDDLKLPLLLVLIFK